MDSHVPVVYNFVDYCLHCYCFAYCLFDAVNLSYGEIFAGQNFCRFCVWPNIHELAIFVDYYVTVASIRENFIYEFSFLEPSVKILSCKNFSSIQYVLFTILYVLFVFLIQFCFY